MRFCRSVPPSLILTLLLLFPGLRLGAQEEEREVPPGEPAGLHYSGAEGELEVPAPRVTDPGIRVDGHLQEAVWGEAAVLESFTQFDPIEGTPASEETEVLVLVGADAIFFGVRAFDGDAEAIRATLAERDNIGRSDDYIRVALDTFHDRRRAFVFMVNPLGIQQDGMWDEGGQRRFGPPIDYNQDFIWESQGVVEEWGYSVEIRIPFKSLRFPDRPVQSWGLNVTRRIQRTGYEEAWAPITREQANELAQAGSLQDLRGLDPGLFLEMNPVLTGKRLGHYDEETDELVHDDPTGEVGMNLTYGITSNLTLDGTYNPDFSQVEADAGQISVNERFALFFPEKRPFFLEGTEVFSLPKRLIYTRSVVSPVAGAKVTGKVGSFNLGYLGAVDDVGGDQPVVNILRLKRDLGASSTVGAAYTDRTLNTDDYSRLAAADARLVLGGRYTLSLLGSESWTTGEDGSDSGFLLNARLERSGRTFSFSGEIEDVSPGFRARNGFIRRVGDTQLQGEVSLDRYGSAGDLVERWGPSVELRGYWDHDAFWRGEGWEEAEVQLGGSVSFRNNLTVFLNLSRSAYSFEPGRYGGLRVDTPDGEPAPFLPDQDLFGALDGVRLFFWMNTWEAVRGRLRTEWRETPVFERSRDVPVEVADAWIADGSFNLYPTEGLTSEIGIRHESLFRKRDGSRYSSATIPRIKTQYQFTRHLFLRGTAEYGSQDREDLLHPLSGLPLLECSEDGECGELEGSEEYELYVELLATYEPSPGTVVYLGYSRDMRDTASFRFQDLTPRSDGIFTKVSYRFRF